MNEISTEVKTMMCILMRNGIKFWIYKKDFEKISNAISNSSRFVNIEDNLLNVADITGIFDDFYIDEIENIENKRTNIEENKLKLKSLM